MRGEHRHVQNILSRLRLVFRYLEHDPEKWETGSLRPVADRLGFVAVGDYGTVHLIAGDECTVSAMPLSQERFPERVHDASAVRIIRARSELR